MKQIAFVVGKEKRARSCLFFTATLPCHKNPAPRLSSPPAVLLDNAATTKKGQATTSLPSSSSLSPLASSFLPCLCLLVLRDVLVGLLGEQPRATLGVVEEAVDLGEVAGGDGVAAFSRFF
jgi:hypothetical protein